MDELIRQLYAAIESGNDEAVENLCSQIQDAICSKPKDIRRQYYEETLHGVIIEFCLQADFLKHPDKKIHTYIKPKQEREQHRQMLVRFQIAIGGIVSYLSSMGVIVSKQYIKALKQQGVTDYDLQWRFCLTEQTTKEQGQKGKPKDYIEKYLPVGKEQETLDALRKDLQGKTGSRYADVIARYVVERKLTDTPTCAALERFIPYGCSHQALGKAIKSKIKLLTPKNTPTCEQ